MRYRESEPLTSVQQASQLLWQYNLLIDLKQEFRICVLRQDDDALIGTLMIKPVQDRKCIIGYSLGRAFWGEGYGKEMVEALVEQLITDEKYDTAQAWCHQDNIASLKILDHCGFEHRSFTSENSTILFERELVTTIDGD